MKELILGTAGHIDHGKTSLVKALTGTNTDRLKEEQKRGITIELGFASLDLPSGNHLGIVDVPGHEKFVKNMVAGASGIDIVAMIVAADEGIMPQTREHMDICNLLGIKYGLIVVTKSDLVDEELKELVYDEIQEFSQKTFLEKAPVIFASSHTGEGLEELVSQLDILSQKIPPREKSWFYRVPVDRVFSMKGFGTIITGTSMSGEIETGENITVYPEKITARVRGLQTHNRSVEKAWGGMRTAVNLHGISMDMISRGNIIATKDSLEPSYMIDAFFTYLESNQKPLKNKARIRFHTGTSETMGYIVLLDRDTAEPGETIPVQFRLNSPVCTVKDDAFVARGYSPVLTIGGGFVLNPLSVKLKRFDKKIEELFEKLKNGTPGEKIEAIIKNSGFKGSTNKEISICTNIYGKKQEQELNHILSSQKIIRTDKENPRYYHIDIFNDICSDILTQLSIYHEKNPLKQGIVKDEIIHLMHGGINEKILLKAINSLIKNKKAVLEKNILRLEEHKVSLGIDLEKIKTEIADSYIESGLTPPVLKEIEKKFNLDKNTAQDVITLLLKNNTLVKVKTDLFFHNEKIEKLKKNVIKYLEANKQMSAPDFKEITGGISRKYLIPLLEFMDQEKITIRVGDIRKLRG
ncbi:MAG: selenocysteine-specific translation elongation factor [Deltaproteobacteria bacterium]|nr:MAG: selenocysteine-specific translation elongation factor [Deltaproteobacteria bacterium]